MNRLLAFIAFLFKKPAPLTADQYIASVVHKEMTAPRCVTVISTSNFIKVGNLQ